MKNEPSETAAIATEAEKARSDARGAQFDGPWQILIIDDDEDIHTVTKMVLRDFSFMDRGANFLSAYSAAQAEQTLRDTPDIALALLDVVMETDDAGLCLVKKIREEMGNTRLRIILRTGQPGQAPEQDVIVRYEINDYKTKAELTAQKLFSAVVSGLRSYRDLVIIEEQIRQRFEERKQARREETRLLDLASAISSELQLDELLRLIIATTSELLGVERSSLFLYDPGSDELWSRVAEGVATKEIRFPSTTGLAGACFSSGEVLFIHDAYSDDRFNPEVDRRTGFQTRNILCMPVRNKQGKALGVVQVLNKIDGAFTDRDEERLKAFSAQFAISLENAQLFEDVLNARNYNESILKSLSNGVLTLDAEFRIIKANQAVERILGWDEGAPINAPVGEVFRGDNVWIADSVHKVAASGQVELAVDTDIVLDGGPPASVNMTTVPLIDVKDEPIGYMLILEDISREKRVKSTMSRYMSRQLIDRVMEADEAALGGTAQEATILFSDIRRFTTLSEQLGPRGTVSLLNDYFTDMVEIVFRHDGILDKYIGDALMAVFGTPFIGEFDADNALTVANQFMVSLRDFNRRHEAAGGAPISIGIGVATGEVISGNIGSLRRMDYTVIGDSVNLAARLESATKLYGTDILVSESVKRVLKTARCFREIDLIRVKGKLEAVRVYESLDHHSDETFANMAQTLEAFAQGLAAYQGRDWRAAIDAYEDALATNGEDGPSKLYLERCRYYQANPPGDDWDGVWAMETK